MSLKQISIIFVCLIIRLSAADDQPQNRVRRVSSLDEAKQILEQDKKELYAKLAAEALTHIKHPETLEFFKLKELTIKGPRGRSHLQGAQIACTLFYVRSIDKKGWNGKRGNQIKITHQLSAEEFAHFNRHDYDNYFLSHWALARFAALHA